MIRTQQIKLPPQVGVNEGLLVFEDETLLAVLGLLDGEFYDYDHGKWHVEAVFSPAVRAGEVIGDLTQWLEQVGDGPI